MHEFAVTSSLVARLLDFAEKAGPGRIVNVHLRIGKLRGLSIDQVKFAYGLFAKGTVLEDSRLIIEETSGEVACAQCGHNGVFEPDDISKFHFGIPPLQCPKCGSNLSIKGGDEFIATKVTMRRAGERITQSVGV